MMTPLQKRRLLSTALDFIVLLTVWLSGAGVWVLLVALLSVWAYYDGMTRMTLE